MKIEVGEYVRTEEGYIERINKPSKRYYWFNDTVMKNSDIPVYGIDTDTEIFTIKKHSKNIIDLIEVGDYVNGKKIKYILEPSIKIEYVAEKILCFETDYPIEKGLRYYHNCDIKSIVTHEQFASVEYKLEEDK